VLLYVMRHGPAEDRAASGFDRDRALTPEGRRVVAHSARQLRALRTEPVARILSSPLRRAIETAEIVRGELSPPPGPPELRDDLAADEPPAFDLVRELTAVGADAILVGHQPSAEVLVRHLCRGAAGLRAMRTATIAAMRWDGTTWSLADVIDPHV
jgi:phosphohistidine phosphatase